MGGWGRHTYFSRDGRARGLHVDNIFSPNRFISRQSHFPNKFTMGSLIHVKKWIAYKTKSSKHDPKIFSFSDSLAVYVLLWLTTSLHTALGMPSFLLQHGYWAHLFIFTLLILISLSTTVLCKRQPCLGTFCSVKELGQWVRFPAHRRRHWWLSCMWWTALIRSSSWTLARKKRRKDEERI